MLQISGNVLVYEISNPNFDHRLLKITKQGIATKKGYTEMKTESRKAGLKPHGKTRIRIQ